MTPAASRTSSIICPPRVSGNSSGAQALEQRLSARSRSTVRRGSRAPGRRAPPRPGWGRPDGPGSTRARLRMATASILCISRTSMPRSRILRDEVEVVTLGVSTHITSSNSRDRRSCSGEASCAFAHAHTAPCAVCLPRSEHQFHVSCPSSVGAIRPCARSGVQRDRYCLGVVPPHLQSARRSLNSR